jgi:hypothetical protein
MRISSMMALVLVLVACDPGQPNDVVGMYVESLSVHVAYSPLCPGERILSVSVYLVHGNVVGDSDDRVLWRAESPSGTRTRDFVVGEAGTGLNQTVPLAEPLAGARELAAQIETTLFPDPTTVFTLDGLRSDQVLTGDGFLGLEEFRGKAPSSC